MRSVTWNRFPTTNLRLIPYLFHLWSEVTGICKAVVRKSYVTGIQDL